MIGSLLNFLGGGVLRLVPEVLKAWDAKNQRAHELAMFDKQIAADNARAAAAERGIQLQNEGAMGLAEIQAIVEATRAQAVPSGVAWVDALSASVRPVLTYWWAIVLYTVALGTEFYMTLTLGRSAPEAFLTIWGDAEVGIVLSMIGFWFADRALRKK